MQKHLAPVFRTAISGFNKADVNMYIAKLARDFGEQSAELKEQLAALQEKANVTDAISAELECANAAVDALSKQVASLQEENERMKSHLSDMTTLFNSAHSCVKALSADFDEKAKFLTELTNTEVE